MPLADASSTVPFLSAVSLASRARALANNNGVPDSYLLTTVVIVIWLGLSMLIHLLLLLKFVAIGALCLLGMHILGAWWSEASWYRSGRHGGGQGDGQLLTEETMKAAQEV